MLLPIPFGAWKLYRAYKYYLRFDRPLATVVAAQAIVALTVMRLWVSFMFCGLDDAVNRVHEWLR